MGTETTRESSDGTARFTITRDEGLFYGIEPLHSRDEIVTGDRVRTGATMRPTYDGTGTGTFRWWPSPGLGVFVCISPGDTAWVCHDCPSSDRDERLANMSLAAETFRVREFPVGGAR